MPSRSPTLVIRAAQLEVLRQTQMQPFTEEMLAHARRLFPEQCAALGDAGTHALVRGALSESLRHGITTQRSACKIVNLAFALGLETLRQPWVSDILGDRSLTPGRRVMQVRELAAERTGGGRHA